MFAGEYVRMSAVRPDWTFGPALKRARGRMAIREAARRAGISEGRWRQLETGYQGSKDYLTPVTTKPTTVASVAEAVGWNVDDALRKAGFSTADLAMEPTEEKSDLSHMSDDELLSELCRRLAQRHEPQPAGMRRPDGVIDYGYFQASPEPPAPSVEDPQASPDK